MYLLKEAVNIQNNSIRRLVDLPNSYSARSETAYQPPLPSEIYHLKNSKSLDKQTSRKKPQIIRGFAVVQKNL